MVGGSGGGKKKKKKGNGGAEKLGVPSFLILIRNKEEEAERHPPNRSPSLRALSDYRTHNKRLLCNLFAIHTAF
jgi:hypothetical protein